MLVEEDELTQAEPFQYWPDEQEVVGVSDGDVATQDEPFQYCPEEQEVAVDELDILQ